MNAGGGVVGQHILRTPENSERICDMIAEGCSLRQVAQVIGLTEAAIRKWTKDDKEFGKHYTKAMVNRLEKMADELVELADADCSGPDGKPDNALVQQRRLQVDTRKWILSKMLPRRFGDKIEISSDPDAPALTRIELVAVYPKQQLEPSTIDADVWPDDGSASDGLTKL